MTTSLLTTALLRRRVRYDSKIELRIQTRSKIIFDPVVCAIITLSIYKDFLLYYLS